LNLQLKDYNLEELINLVYLFKILLL